MSDKSRLDRLQAELERKKITFNRGEYEWHEGEVDSILVEEDDIVTDYHGDFIAKEDGEISIRHDGTFGSPVMQAVIAWYLIVNDIFFETEAWNVGTRDSGQTLDATSN